jgi:hypothetical protein
MSPEEEAETFAEVPADSVLPDEPAADPVTQNGDTEESSDDEWTDIGEMNVKW